MRYLRPAKTRRRGKALHGAFLGLGVLLASTPLLGRSPLRTRRLAGRRKGSARTRTTWTRAARTRSAESWTRAKAWTGSAESRSPAGTWRSAGRTASGRMHGTANFARSTTLRALRVTATAGSTGTRPPGAATIENRTAALDRTSRLLRVGRRSWLLDDWRWRRRLVHRPGPGLWHDHPSRDGRRRSGHNRSFSHWGCNHTRNRRSRWRRSSYHRGSCRNRAYRGRPAGRWVYGNRINRWGNGRTHLSAGRYRRANGHGWTRGRANLNPSGGRLGDYRSGRRLGRDGGRGRCSYNPGLLARKRNNAPWRGWRRWRYTLHLSLSWSLARETRTRR